MNGVEARVTLALLGMATIATVPTGRYLSYVKPSMAPVLVLTGLVLIVLSLQGGLRDWRRHDERRVRLFFAGRLTPVGAEPDTWDGEGQDRHHGDVHRESGHGSGHESGHGSGRTWVLLLAPVLCLVLVSPPSLGAFSAERAANAVSTPPPLITTQDEPMWAPLPQGEAIPLSLGEFIVRAHWDQTRSLTGRRVRLTGFVVPRRTDVEQRGDWTLARMGIMCCAADASVYKVVVSDPDRAVPPEVDTWVEVEGTWVPATAPAATEADPPDPVLELASIRIVPEPDQPYE